MLFRDVVDNRAIPDGRKGIRCGKIEYGAYQQIGNEDGIMAADNLHPSSPIISAFFRFEMREYRVFYRFLGASKIREQARLICPRKGLLETSVVPHYEQRRVE